MQNICSGKHDASLIHAEPRRGSLQPPLWVRLSLMGGFFVFPDIRNSVPSKEVFQAVVEVQVGDASGRHIEYEFT